MTNAAHTNNHKRPIEMMSGYNKSPELKNKKMKFEIENEKHFEN